ncbi:MAG: ubiquinone biosynthesis regulatory protein kinase UbiB [Pseudomonadales bacterium]
MALIQNCKRSARILRVAARYRLDALIDKSRLPWALRALLSPLAILPNNKAARGERIRLALQDLGPVFIKLGQMLSTRPDLLPDDIAASLNQLQDQVEPFASDQAIKVVEQAFGQSVNDLFTRFDTTPLASASIAQVHAAELTLPGQDKPLDVVVKIVRPGIERLIEQDTDLMFSLARMVKRYAPDGERLKPIEVVSDYRDIIYDELNMQLEAANTSQLRRNFLNSDLLYVPEVYWDFVRSNVLVMERIYGTPICNIDELHAANVNMKELAERGVEIFFSQVFRDSFFHADMHPGNIFVNVSNPDKPQYIGIDCAIIGSLDDDDLYYLARNLLAIFQRDYRTVAEMHVESGWVPEHIRPGDFESAIRSVCEPIFEKPLAEISFGQILLYLFTVARRFEMSVQPNLVLLEKTLLAVEGLGRQLYPQLDLWQTAQPFLEDWMAKRYAPAQVLQRMQKQAPTLLQHLPQLPELLIDNLKSSAALRESAQQQQRQLQILEEQGRRRERRQKLAAGILLVAGALLFFGPQASLFEGYDFRTSAAIVGGLGVTWLLLG